MRFFEGEPLNDILYAIAAIPFGFAVIGFATQVLQYAV